MPVRSPILVTLACISCIVNVFLVITAWSRSRLSERTFDHSAEIEVSEIPIPFSPATTAFALPDPDFPVSDDHKWATIVPPHSGFVRLGPNGTAFAVSMYHQLHCVNGVRFAYNAARKGYFKTDAEKAASFGHANHCFDFLRQALLCRADTTLIPVDGATGRERGDGVVRRCKVDETEVRAFVDENRRFWKNEWPGQRAVAA